MSIRGYQSPIKLDLGQLPFNQEPTIARDFVALYNAVHTMAAYYGTVGGGQQGLNKDSQPWESMRSNSYWWILAETDIDAGDVITTYKGMVDFGAGPVAVDGALLGSHTNGGANSMLTGIATVKALKGDRVQMAVGPMIIKSTGATTDTPVYARDAVVGGVAINDGGLYNSPPPDGIQIGKVVAPEAIFIPAVFFT